MRRRVVLVFVLSLAGAASLSACSDDDKNADVPATTTTAQPSTTIAGGASTTTGPTASSTSPGATTPASNGNNTSVNLVGPTGPSSPVDCNAQTTDVELQWTATGATSVELRIDDGPVFARYPNGRQTKLLPLECDGKPHTYEIRASAGGSKTSSAITLRSAS
jgi:hypothetical protein